MTDVASSALKVQQEGITFNQPVSEATQTSIGGLANYLRECILPVGSVVWSMLDEPTFQAQTTNPSPERWVLCDGRSVVGSAYQTLTGATNIPDLRGVFARGKNNGRNDGNQNPDGDLALGTLQTNQFGTHNHSYHDPGHAHVLSYAGGGAPYLRSNAYAGGTNISATDATGSQALNVNFSTTDITFVANGGNETRPTVVTLNCFIRIN